MIYLIIFNAHHYSEEQIHAKTWVEFIEQLNRIVEMHGMPPDLIYLKDSRK